MSKVKLIHNTSELGAGTRGSSLGSRAMQVAAFNANSDFFSKHEAIYIANQNHLLSFPPKEDHAKYIGGIKKVYDEVATTIKDTFESGDFPVILAGDHASAGGTIAGICQANPGKRLGVIWIDAHADLHSPYTTPSGNMHGMPLATAISEDNLDHKINDPSPEVVSIWNELKAMGGDPCVRPEDIIFMGVRSTEPPEDALLEKYRIKNFPVEQLRETRLDIIVNTVENRLEDCDLVYISFDVDSMDPYIVSKGTGTPVENGLTPEEAEILVRKFAVWSKCCCIEFVEINPCLDDKLNRMAEVAFEILEKVCGDIESKEE